MKKADASQVELLSSRQEESFVEEWYEYADPGHFWMKWRLRSLLAQMKEDGIPFDKPLRGLDIGSGRGVVRLQLEKETNWTVDCADLDISALQTAHSGRGRLLFYDVTEENPSCVGKYDFILLLDVIEHILEPANFLQSVLKHLKPGGLLIVNVPALPALFSLYDTAVGHHRRYTKTTLAEAIAVQKAEVVDLRYWGLTLVPILMARKFLMSLLSKDNVVKTGFAPPAPWINGLFDLLSRAETTLFRSPVLGTSLLLIARKVR